MGRTENVAMLRDTMEILARGEYTVNGKTVKLKLTPEQRTRVQVFLPDEVSDLTWETIPTVHRYGKRCQYSCVNADSFALARKRLAEGRKNLLVLNLANPVHPGGGVHRGAQAQEEDLCRKSSLLCSLESDAAHRYYRHNRTMNTLLGSDGIIITPEVEIIKDEYGQLLEDTAIVSVMTCAAPMITFGLEGLSEGEYRDMVYDRITGMLTCAAYCGYRELILGAFGCGAFSNDARVVSDLFYRALKEFGYNGMNERDLFDRIDFAVWDRSPSQYNFNQFNRNFAEFYRDENEALREQVAKRRHQRESAGLDRIRGCLFGGAIGDALGYPVEFLSAGDILADYGPGGITDYDRDPESGLALVSDDTQMTLFTANGLLYGNTRHSCRGIGAPPRTYIAKAYLDWLRTQTEPFSPTANEARLPFFEKVSWLCDVPRLYSRRAPGMTCLSALKERSRTPVTETSYTTCPINNSKGCGGVMRVAPLALIPWKNTDRLDREGAEVAAITHGHPLGFLSASVLCHIIQRTVFPGGEGCSLAEVTQEAVESLQRLYGEQYPEDVGQLADLIRYAARLAENGDSDAENIPLLGEGWVAEETVAIAIYCSLRHQSDFSAGIIAAVNHSGDSDSTGAVTGNILGALLGYEAIEPKWKEGLELADVTEELAVDLCHGCPISEYGFYRDDDWERKYLYAKHKA